MATAPSESVPPDERAPVITGLGALAPIGDGVEAFWESLAAGRHAIASVTRYPLEGFAVRLAAAVPDGPHTERFARPPRIEDADASEDYALRAAREALESAGLPHGVDAARVGVVVGTSAGPLWARSVYELGADRSPAFLHAFFQKVMLHGATAGVARRLGLRGPTLTVSTACTSSAVALVHACAWLAQGDCDVVLAGGVDVLLPETLGGFHAMGAMCPAPCAPFSLPEGMTVGEGAGFVVLERAGDARRRGARVRASLAGHGTAVDGYHATAPDPGGVGVTRATRLALARAGIAPESVGYVNAHGTGTDANDAAEVRGLRRVLGDHADRVPVSSTKSYFGHTLGAAGVLEAVATVLSLERGVVPPTLNFTSPRGGGPADPVAERTPRAHAYDTALSVNAGFGGHNAALVLRAPSPPGVSAVPACPSPHSRGEGQPSDATTATPHPATATPHPATATHSPNPVAGCPSPRLWGEGHAGTALTPGGEGPLYVSGAAIFSAHGDGTDGFDRALREGEALWRPLAPAPDGRPRPTHAARMPDPDPARYARGTDPRSLDAVARALLAVTASALADAGIKPRGALRERVGLYAVLSGVSPDSERVFWDSVRARGHARLSAPAFARIVTNTPAGAVARALSLLGPSSVVVGRAGATLAALGLAAHELSRGDSADAIAVSTAAIVSDDLLADRAFSHPPGGERERAALPLGEAAVCFALTTARGPGPAVRVAGWAHAGPDGLATAARAACERAGLAPEAIELVYRASGSGGGAGDALERAGLAGLLPRARVCTPALVVGECDAGDAVALLAAREALARGLAHPGHGAGPSGGRARVALVVSARGDEGAHAVVLTLDEDA